MRAPERPGRWWWAGLVFVVLVYLHNTLPHLTAMPRVNVDEPWLMERAYQVLRTGVPSQPMLGRMHRTCFRLATAICSRPGSDYSASECFRRACSACCWAWASCCSSRRSAAAPWTRRPAWRRRCSSPRTATFSAVCETPAPTFRPSSLSPWPSAHISLAGSDRVRAGSPRAGQRGARDALSWQRVLDRTDPARLVLARLRPPRADGAVRLRIPRRPAPDLRSVSGDRGHALGRSAHANRQLRRRPCARLAACVPDPAGDVRRSVTGTGTSDWSRTRCPTRCCGRFRPRRLPASARSRSGWLARSS